MWDQLVLLDRDLVRMTFIVGVGVSVLLYERTHLTTGGIVVPGYIGVQLLNPGSLLVTAVNAILTYLLVSVVLPKFTVVFGRARFVLNIFVSVTIAVSITTVVGALWSGSNGEFQTIGYVIPALIAYDMNRQGARKTGSAVMIAGAMSAVPALLIVAFMPEVVDRQLPFDSGMLDFGEFWLPFAALISTGVSTLLQSGHRLRCGGFIGAMYLGLSAVNPVQTLYMIALALATYWLVQFGLKPVMIVFGRRKFATMMMVGSVLSWVSLEIIGMLTPGGIQLGDMPIAVLAVPALLANDMERSSVAEVLTGSFIGGAATVSTLLVLTAVVDGSAVSPWSVLLMASAAAVLLYPWMSGSRLTTAALRSARLKRTARSSLGTSPRLIPN